MELDEGFRGRLARESRPLSPRGGPSPRGGVVGIELSALRRLKHRVKGSREHLFCKLAFDLSTPYVYDRQDELCHWPSQLPRGHPGFVTYRGWKPGRIVPGRNLQRRELSR